MRTETGVSAMAMDKHAASEQMASTYTVLSGYQRPKGGVKVLIRDASGREPHIQTGEEDL